MAVISFIIHVEVTQRTVYRSVKKQGINKMSFSCSWTMSFAFAVRQLNFYELLLFKFK